MAIKPALTATTMAPEERTALYDAVGKWHDVASKIATLQAEEKALRLSLFNNYFPTPREGVNKVDLGFGKMLECDFRINRKVDETALDAAISGGLVLPDDVVNLINYKPQLATTNWKAASVETRAKFGDIVTEEPGTPGMKITTPKK